jgi:uncharacterized protein YjgD (DUF1641 family)
MVRRIVAKFAATSFLILACLPSNGLAQPGRPSDSLQSGLPISRTIGRSQSQRFSLILDQNQFAQIVVDQRGIDVIVRVFSPDGKPIVEFDSPNGANGPENVTVVAVTAGTYSLEVTPLSQMEDLAAGSFEIRMTELRSATSQELQSARSREILKEKGIALLMNLAEFLPDIHVLQMRVHTQTQAAQLAWPINEKLARRLMTDAISGVREYMEHQENADQDFYQGYNAAMQMRQEVMQVLSNNDPDLALSFLRSTRDPANPFDGQPDQELRLEINLASQMASKDPRRALQIAEDSLTKGYSSGLTNVISGMRISDPLLATRLAKETAAKLQAEKILPTPEAANLAISLLRLAHSPAPKSAKADSAGAPDMGLLSDAEYRDLFMKALSESLAFSPEAGNPNSMDMNSVRSVLSSLKSMTTEMRNFAPASIAAIDEKTASLNTTFNPQERVRQNIQAMLYRDPVDQVMEALKQVPLDMRDSFYQQLANRAAGAGDIARGRQIATDYIVNARQRQDAMNNVERQAVQYAINKGRMDEAIAGIRNLASARDRANMIGQIASRIGPGLKKDAALNLLEQTRRMLGTSPRAESQEQMNALLQIASAFSQLDSGRAFEIVEPILDQFSEMSQAAVVLSGFGQVYFQDGELILQNGNPVGNTANQLMQALGKLAVADFDRSRSDADKLRYPGVRAGAYLAIAQQAINPPAPRR